MARAGGTDRAGGRGRRKSRAEIPGEGCQPHLRLARLAYEARRERGAGPHEKAPAGPPGPAGWGPGESGAPGPH